MTLGSEGEGPIEGPVCIYPEDSRENRNFPYVIVPAQKSWSYNKAGLLQTKSAQFQFLSNPQTHDPHMGLGAWCAQAYTTAWTALNLGFRSFLLPEMNSSTLQDALLAIISTSANPWIKETVARCNCEGRIDT